MMRTSGISPLSQHITLYILIVCCWCIREKYVLTCHYCRCSTSPIVTLVVGREARIFAAHEDVLAKSPVFANVLRSQYMEPSGKRITIPDEEPEVLSSVLEYLYKDDYSPRLVHNRRRDTWEIETNDEATIFHQATGTELLKDTVIYCAADKYRLDDLKRIALRKQGLRKCFLFCFNITPLLTLPILSIPLTPSPPPATSYVTLSHPTPNPPASHT